MKPLLLAAVVLAVACPARGGPLPAARPGAAPADWDALFRQGGVGCGPVGPTRGTVLYADGHLPRVRARAQGAVWKGKTFHGDGTLTNRWLGGVQAVPAVTHVGPSWLDGRPCLVVEYAPTAAVFGGVRDELREVAPGVWLGRSYDAASGRPKTWFVLRAG